MSPGLNELLKQLFKCRLENNLYMESESVCKCQCVMDIWAVLSHSSQNDWTNHFVFPTITSSEYFKLRSLCNRCISCWCCMFSMGWRAHTVYVIVQFDEQQTARPHHTPTVDQGPKAYSPFQYMFHLKNKKQNMLLLLQLLLLLMMIMIWLNTNSIDLIRSLRWANV